MSYEPQFNPNDPHWWLREPEYRFPETVFGEPIPTEAEVIKGYAEELRTNTARLPRAIVERYIIVKNDPLKLRQFLNLMLDMRTDGSLDPNPPGEEEEESMLPPFDDEKQASIDAMMKAFYTQPTSKAVEFFELERYAKALTLLRGKGH